MHSDDDLDSAPFAYHHSLGMKHYQGSFGDHRHDGKDSTKIVIPVVPPIPPFTTTVIKAGLQANVNITPTFSNVNDLVVPLAANTNYEFWGFIINDRSGFTGNMLLRFNGPTDAILKWHNAGNGYDGAYAIGNTDVIVVTSVSTTKKVAHPRGIIKTASAGNLQLEYTQETAPQGGSIRIDADSFLCIRKM